MQSLQLIGTILRELTTRERSPRVPEPDLVMDDPDKVEAYVNAGRDAAIIAPTYLFHCAHICEVTRPGDTVLDLACGPATQLGMVAQLNPDSRFIGVDLSKEMLQQARNHIAELDLTNVDLQLGDIANLRQFEDGSIDAVFSTLSLHHLPTLENLASTLSEIARIVKPEGGIYLTDFAHLKSEKSMHQFAYQHQERQSDFFTLDYFNSLRAAFYASDFRDLAQRHLGTRARLYAMRPVPIMIAIKSPARRGLEPSIKKTLATQRAALPVPQQGDLKDLIGLFRLGGLNSNLLV